MKHDRRTFLRNTVLTSGAITLRNLSRNAKALAEAAAPLAEAGDSAAIRQQFQAPAKKYGPIARWWWPGNDVNETELRREIGALDEAGFGGAEIQAFYKGFTPEYSSAHHDQIQTFATPSYFRHVAAAADEARKRGLFVDCTFGSGWPFGGGDAITPELATIELRSTRTSVSGPAKLQQRLQIPSITDRNPQDGTDVLAGLPEGWAERMKKRGKVVAVIAVRGDAPQYVFQHSGTGESLTHPGRLDKGTAVNLTAQFAPDGTLSWDVPEGTWQVFVFCSTPTGQRVNAGAGKGPQLVMDHLSAEAFAAHAKRVGDDSLPYLREYFGKGLRAIFCDSLEVAAKLFWSDDFLDQFRSRRGYDLAPYLPLLQVQSHEEPFGKFIDLPIFEMADEGARVREDYRRTVSDLMIERFYEQFDNWAHSHNLLSRTQAHGSPTDVLRVYGECDIPETEDLYDQGGYDFLKMAASAAHIYGRSVVGSESFVWTGAAYQTTPEKMKAAADELFTAGINAIVYHGFAYQVPQIAAPGWHPFSGIGTGNFSSQFNELNPLWPYFAKLNPYITRLQYLSQAGTNVAAVALYWNDLLHGAQEAPTVPRLNQALLDAGYNYDHMNPASLLRCAVHDRMLVTQGGARYRALVLPALKVIDAAVAEKIAAFAQAGLPIIFAGEPPTHAEGLLSNAENTRSVANAMRSLHKSGNVFLASTIDSAITMLAKAASPNIRFRSKPLFFIQKRVGRLNTYFLRNPSDEAQPLAAEFESDGNAQLWDPWTGKVTPLASRRRSNGWQEIELNLEPLSSALIVFDPDSNAQATTSAPAAGAKQKKVVHSIPVGTAGWKLKATGLFPSGKTSELERDLPRLVDWSLDPELRGFSGQGVYTTTFTVPPTQPGQRIALDLGRVSEVADVTVNGKKAATLLLRPYQLDVTELVQPGTNHLQVTITNTLYNCMALREPRTFRPGPAENPSGLMSGGLIGPVELRLMQG